MMDRHQMSFHNSSLHLGPIGSFSIKQAQPSPPKQHRRTIKIDFTVPSLPCKKSLIEEPLELSPKPQSEHFKWSFNNTTPVNTSLRRLLHEFLDKDPLMLDSSTTQTIRKIILVIYTLQVSGMSSTAPTNTCHFNISSEWCCLDDKGVNYGDIAGILNQVEKMET